MTTPLMPAVWDDQELSFHQDACYRGRTNGYTTRFIRSFKQYEIDDVVPKKRKVVLELGSVEHVSRQYSKRGGSGGEKRGIRELGI